MAYYLSEAILGVVTLLMLPPMGSSNDAFLDGLGGPVGP